MDDSRFDSLIRSLICARSRRGALSVLLGGILGLLGFTETTAKKKHKGKGKKRKKKRATTSPVGDPCPGQRLCGGVCIPTNQCCTREDCPALVGYQCCNGVCTNEKGGPGSSCTQGSQCCSDYCRQATMGAQRCAATCRGKNCSLQVPCCRGFSCLHLDANGFGTCGGCKDAGRDCESDAECCFSTCTAIPSDPQGKCLSYPGEPCEKSYDCRTCFFGSQCTVTINGAPQDICINGICGCPDDDECCVKSDCAPDENCVRNEFGLHGVCKPILPGS